MLPLVLTLLSLAFAGAPAGGYGPPPTEGTVASVYDGDTLTLESGDKIRLRWVNTPELRPAEAYGTEAKQLAVDLVLRRKVRLIVAPDERDGYGRVVAGVRLDNRDLSLELVKKGLAHVFIIPPEDQDTTELLAAEREARAARRGIWSDEHYQGIVHLTSFHHNAPGDDRENVNGEYARVANISGTEIDTADLQIRNSSGRTFQLASVLVPAGHTFQIRSGKGVEQPDPLKQLTVYLGSDTPVFDNDGDKIEILDAKGHVIDWRAAGDAR